MGRIQRFLQRVQGTDRLIFLLILGYDLYLYYQLVQIGLGWLVAIVMGVGLVAGLLTAVVLERSPQKLAHVITGVGYLVMGVYLVTQVGGAVFPVWVYLINHVLLWFWFVARFWFEGRPYETVTVDPDEGAEYEP